MQKTQNFNLNKPEIHDPLRVEDFNENADKIDTTLAALNTAMAAGVKAQWGSYTGNGKYGSSTPNKLTFDFEPKLVLIVGYNHDNTASQQPGTAVLMNGMASAPVLFSSRANSGGTAFSYTLLTTFSGNAVSWYCEYQNGQMNYSGCTYYYMAIG